MDRSPFVSVIIPVYKQKDVFAKNLGALWRQSYPSKKYEIIVVDDGSEDGLEGLIRETRKMTAVSLIYLSQTHKGPAAARNLGIQNARGEIVAFTDADCLVSENWIEEISRGYTEERVAGIGGTTKPIADSSFVSQYCAYIKMNTEPGRTDGVIDYVITANASFRKDSLAAVGGFDERYNFAGGEDPDLCYRLRETGFIFKHNRRAVVYNPNKKNLKELLDTYFRYGIGDVFLMLRRLSTWDLVSVKRSRRKACFAKAVAKFLVIYLECFFLAYVPAILKFPFRVMAYYGEGLSMGRGAAYAFLDIARIVAFHHGRAAGYMTGKFKGFKRPDIA